MVDHAAPKSRNPAAARQRQSLRQRHIAWVRTSGMSGLLVVLVLGVFVVPVLAPYRVIADVLLTLVIVTGVVAVAEHPKFAIGLVVMGVVAIAFRWMEWILPLPPCRYFATRRR